MLVDPGVVSFPDESIAIETFFERYPKHTLLSALAPVIDPQLSSAVGFQPNKLEPAQYYPVHQRIEFAPEDRRDSLHFTEVPQTLFMVAGHPDISFCDRKVESAFENPQSISGSENGVGLIYKLLQRTGAEGNFDYILCDLSPYANTLNKLFVMSSHFLIIPSMPDSLSLMAMRRIAGLLSEWDSWMRKKRQRLETTRIVFSILQPTNPSFSGIQSNNTQSQTTDLGTSPEARKWMDAIRNEYEKTLLPTLACRGMCLPMEDNVYHELARIRNFQSAGTAASAAHIPVFALKIELTRATTNSTWAMDTIVPVMIGTNNELANRVIQNCSTLDKSKFIKGD